MYMLWIRKQCYTPCKNLPNVVIFNGKRAVVMTLTPFFRGGDQCHETRVGQIWNTDANFQ